MKSWFGASSAFWLKLFWKAVFNVINKTQQSQSDVPRWYEKRHISLLLLPNCFPTLLVLGDRENHTEANQREAIKRRLVFIPDIEHTYFQSNIKSDSVFLPSSEPKITSFSFSSNHVEQGHFNLHLWINLPLKLTIHSTSPHHTHTHKNTYTHPLLCDLQLDYTVILIYSVFWNPSPESSLHRCASDSFDHTRSLNDHIQCEKQKKSTEDRTALAAHLTCREV